MKTSTGGRAVDRSIMPLGLKLTLLGGSQFYIELYKEKFKQLLEPLMGIWPNSTGMVPGWSPTKIVQMVLIGCLSRSRGQKIGFHNATFKNLLVWNYQAQSFHCDLWPFPQVSDPGHFGPSCSWVQTTLK